jgi:hypothetical protein
VRSISQRCGARPRSAGPRRPLALLLALAALVLALLAATAASGARSNTGQTAAAPAILITTYRLTPKVQRTVHFTGYATYVFNTHPKRRIASASARIVGAQAHAVRISATAVSRSRKRFTVKLVFPGEQGNPGKLVVRLSTTGA